MATLSPSDIITAANFAWQIYRMGWGEESDASQQYLDFGNDIKCLAENLNNICRVVENAQAKWAQFGQFRGPLPQKEWNLSSLREITGDYYRTLADCERLLQENTEFRRTRNFAYNIGWNVVIQPKVNQLRKRLDSHNSKISILLKPLELNLLSDIHHDLVERIDAVHQSILHLQGLLIPDVGQALSEQGRVISDPLDIPADIEKEFQEAAAKSHPEIRTPGKFPLQVGADAFVAHLAESTIKFRAGNFLNERTPSPKQYLCLLKCIWIMKGLQDSDELKGTPKDSQWPGYVSQLNEDLSAQCQRFQSSPAQRLITPDLSSIRSADEYNIWLGENIADYISPHFEHHREEVLKIPLPCPSDSITRNMTIYHLQSTKYRIVESVDDKRAVLSRPEELKIDVDLKTINLTPIYAIPSSRPKGLEVLIKSESDQTNPTFLEHKHVLRLQHLLTGYKVYERYDQAMVTVSFFISDQAAPIEEHGRLQLWLPHHFGNSLTSNSPTPSEVQIQGRRGSVSTASEPMTMNNGRKTKTSSRHSSRSTTSTAAGTGTGRIYPDLSSNPASPTTTPTRQSSFSFTPTPATRQSSFGFTPIPATRQSSFSYMPTRSASKSSINFPSVSSSISSKRYAGSVKSDMTASSSMSRTTITSVTTISTGTGTAHLHEKPAKPMLVIFLKSQDASAKLAIAAIQIDDNTTVKRERCACRTSESPCRVSCIERSDGYLLAQRWDAGQGLGSWNLTKLGMEQRKELPADAWNYLKRVSMKFENTADRIKFAGGPCPCKPKMHHDLARCILAGHQGVFGVVKQIGSQRLRNYHEERDKASARSMVLGSMPEDEP